jgi:hypothetical protein
VVESPPLSSVEPELEPLLDPPLDEPPSAVTELSCVGPPSVEPTSPRPPMSRPHDARIRVVTATVEREARTRM